ncbi:MAG TPA: GAF domain-containing protein, partial [Planctomycetota bacterium]|nr:GAF domain-containing protein [Planctomycetota bacterium]
MNEKPIAEIVEELSLAYCVPNRAAVVTQSLEGLLGNLMKRVPCRKGVLVLVKEDKSLQPVHWFNFESVDEKKAKWEISKSLAEHACEKKSVIRVHVADEWTRSKFPTAGTHGSTSILSAPLLDGARILGVFQLFDRQGANPVFSDQDMHIAGLHSISISLYLAETRRFAG